MAITPLDYKQLDSKIRELDSTVLGCRTQIGELRRKMDIACDKGQITLHEWRILLDKVTVVQDKLVG